MLILRHTLETYEYWISTLTDSDRTLTEFTNAVSQPLPQRRVQNYKYPARACFLVRN